jgi:hypothetical protein
MAILYADRVKDTTTTTGTGNITLAGTPPTGFQSFNAAFGTSAGFFFYYCIEGGAEWEVGRGHLSASTTLVRDNIMASSNAGSAVSFSAGTKNVFATIPAQNAGQWTQVIKPVDESRNTTTTLTNDTHLQFPMVASKAYIVRGTIWVYCPATPDFKFLFVHPAVTGTNIWQKLSYGSDIAAMTTSHALSFATITMAQALQQYITIQLHGALLNIAGAGGTFAFQWAQATSDGSDVSVAVGSFLEYRQIN